MGLKKQKVFHYSYTALFGAWFGWFLVADSALSRGWTGPWWFWPAILVAFLAIEIPAALRKKDEIDTFSEHVWAFIQGYKDRAPLGMALAAALGLRVMSLPLILGDTIREMPWQVSAYTTWIALGFGIGRWLWGHFPKLGRDG